MNLIETLTGKAKEPDSWPLVHVRDTIVFPHALTQFLAMTKSSIQAVTEALKGDKRIFVALAKPEQTEQVESDVFHEGTLSRIVQHARMPDGSWRLVIEGERRGCIEKFTYNSEYISVSVAFFAEESAVSLETSALMRSAQKSFLQYAELIKKLPPDAMLAADRAETPHKLCDIISAALLVKPAKKQEILSLRGADERLMALCVLLETEIDLLSIQKKIGQKVKGKIDRNQKEYFLQEQLKEINRELGKDPEQDETKELAERILARNPCEETIAKAKKEIARLQKLQPFSPEAGVVRTYLEWIADLPWTQKKEERKSLAEAEEVLERDHYGMKKAKDRILEFIAVHQLKDPVKGPILCFVGPPGTGKTSLGRSVARALGRDFVRISLGGVRDEAEIRGHRRTYVGALPGKIIQSMKKAGSANPVFLLDEIDKMSSDFRGDPASALLEVLDPEQNNTFQDHYLELPYDLSSVLFITTANSLQGIPFPLLDRMEVIEIPGYSEYEKLEIARRYIVPRTLEDNGFRENGIEFRKDALLEIIRKYTMESGVRNLDRAVSRVVRKLARKVVSEGPITDERKAAYTETVTAAKIRTLLGKERKHDDVMFRNPKPGVAYGLAWTEAGGSLLPVEAIMFPGSGNLILTGNLGDVMKESARTALSWLRGNSARFGLPETDSLKADIHIHVPEGAIPKDGPSAGITLTVALVSMISGKPLEKLAAMTGEITLSGRILPVGGIKEKVLAAHRNNVFDILLPKANEIDLEDIPPEVRKQLTVTWCETADDALAFLLASSLASLRTS